MNVFNGNGVFCNAPLLYIKNDHYINDTNFYFNVMIIISNSLDHTTIYSFLCMIYHQRAIYQLLCFIVIIFSNCLSSVEKI